MNTCCVQVCVDFCGDDTVFYPSFMHSLESKWSSQQCRFLPDQMHLLVTGEICSPARRQLGGARWEAQSKEPEIYSFPIPFKSGWSLYYRYYPGETTEFQADCVRPSKVSKAQLLLAFFFSVIKPLCKIDSRCLLLGR